MNELEIERIARELADHRILELEAEIRRLRRALTAFLEEPEFDGPA